MSFSFQVMNTSRTFLGQVSRTWLSALPRGMHIFVYGYVSPVHRQHSVPGHWGAFLPKNCTEWRMSQETDPRLVGLCGPSLL